MDELELYPGAYDGQQIDEAIGRVLSNQLNGSSNRNLLDNGWFTVNQRGLASYTGSAYTVDRWRFQNNSGTCNVVSGGITFSNSASGYGYFTQILDFTMDSAKTYTLSVIADGQVYSVRSGGTGITLPSGLYLYFANSTQITIRIPCNLNSSEVISAVKLELGSISTLANDAPPCFAEELAKCQRYAFVPQIPSGSHYLAPAFNLGTSSSSTLNALIYTPVIMRSTPTASGSLHSIRGNGVQINSSISIGTALAPVGNTVIVPITTSSSFSALTMGYGVLFSSLILSADL